MTGRHSMKRCTFVILGISLLLSGTFLSRTSPGEAADQTEYDKPGPYQVRSLEFPDLTDAKRKDRKVPLKVHFPATGGKFPLVVFSHGGGGNWDSYIHQVRHLASHGYVVVCVEHTDSNNERIKYYMSRRGGHLRFADALNRTTHDPQAMLQRPGDVSFAIDQAVLWNTGHKALAGMINTGRIGVMGHSYGAYTTLAVCGARPIVDYLEPVTSPGRGLGRDYSDPRVTFGLAMSPQPPGTTYFSTESYKTINRPIVGMTGSKDTGKTFDDKAMPAEARWQFWDLLPPGNKYFLWLENADHFSFADNPKAWLFPSESRTDVQRISKAMMALFCDHFLKGKKEAGGRMNREYVNSLSGTVVTEIQWREK